jgi:hypothetical protein
MLSWHSDLICKLRLNREKTGADINEVAKA